MSLATVPIGNRPPPILSPNCVQMKFHHANNAWATSCTWNVRKIGSLVHAGTPPCPDAVFGRGSRPLGGTARPGRHDLRSTKASRAADQVPRFAVAFHLEDIGMHQMVLAGDRPLDQDPSGAETAHPAIDVGSAPLPRHVPPRVVLRAGKALAPLPWTPPAGRFLLLITGGLYKRASWPGRVTKSIRRSPGAGFRQGRSTLARAKAPSSTAKSGALASRSAWRSIATANWFFVENVSSAGKALQRICSRAAAGRQVHGRPGTRPQHHPVVREHGLGRLRSRPLV